jgi:hypothetical protein
MLSFAALITFGTAVLFYLTAIRIQNLLRTVHGNDRPFNTQKTPAVIIGKGYFAFKMGSLIGALVGIMAYDGLFFVRGIMSVLHPENSEYAQLFFYSLFVGIPFGLFAGAFIAVISGIISLVWIDSFTAK